MRIDPDKEYEGREEHEPDDDDEWKAWRRTILDLISVMNGMKTVERSHRAVTHILLQQSVAPEHILVWVLCAIWAQVATMERSSSSSSTSGVRGRRRITPLRKLCDESVMLDSAWCLQIELGVVLRPTAGLAVVAHQCASCVGVRDDVCL